MNAQNSAQAQTKTGRPKAAAVVITILLLACILIPTLIGLFATVGTDWLWFESLGQLAVYRTRLVTQATLFLAGFLLAMLFLAANWFLLPRSLLRRIELVIRPRYGTVRLDARGLTGVLVVAGLIAALVFGSLASDHWFQLLTFSHAVPFGYSDPIFGLDAAFYVFQLPIYRAALDWVAGLVVAALIGAAMVYTVGSGLREKGPLAHLSILGALFLLSRAVGYWMARWELLDTARGVVFGAGYTDIHARLPLFQILAIIVMLCAVALLANLLIRRLRLLLIVGGLWLAVAVLGPVYPTIVQRFVVAPNELAVERTYIDYNIAATRRAFDLEDIVESDFTAAGQLTEQTLQDNAVTIDNIRLWDWRPMLDAYGQLQEIRLYYAFNDVDVDRYVIGGTLREVMLAARELDVNQLPAQAQTWVNQHLVFTHGYGACLSPVNQVSSEGLPLMLVRDIPPQSQDPILAITQPGIYFGELANNYIIVNTSEPEFDLPSGDDNLYTRYEGSDGVLLGNFWRRLLLALRFDASQIFFSSAVNPQSRILFHRQLTDRVETLAPFLSYDPDPYTVIADGRLVWLYDAYTWSDRFPYSEPFWGVNYIRNSVKIAIDAYTGETTFYVVDTEDPLIRTYQAIFPGLFVSADQMPQSLRDHWRYPERLFRIQADAYAAYHMRDTQVFYNKEDLWAAPREQIEGQEQEMEPYYVVMKLPGTDQAEFLLMRPYVPNGRSNMIAWLYADSDGEDYGQMGVFKFPKDEVIYGPAQIEARFNQDTAISQQLTLWDQRGSQAMRGNLLVVPVDDTLLYVQPLYLQAEAGRLPELKRVLVAYGNRVVMADSLATALIQVLTGVETTEPLPEEPVATDVASLARSAQEHYEAAQACLQIGDWTCYGDAQAALAADLEAIVAATEQ